MKLEKYRLVFEHYDEGYNSLEEWDCDTGYYYCPLTELKQGETVPFKTEDGWDYSPIAYWDPKFVCKTVNTDGVLLEIHGNNHSFKSTEDKWRSEYEINGKSRDIYTVTLEEIKN